MRAGRLCLERATQGALAATIVLVVFGSSGVQPLRTVGSPLRWVALLVLAIAACAWAVQRGTRLTRLRAAEAVTLLLAVVAFASAAWSVEPRVSVEHAVTFLVAVTAAAAIGRAVGGSSATAAGLAATLVSTTVCVCLAGVVVYLVDPAKGAQAASPGTAFRFSGLGENPNAVPMLAAVTLPLAAWLAYTGPRRALSCAAIVVLVAEIVASGSRGALAGGVAAAFAVALLLPTRGRARAAAFGLAVAVAVIFVAGNRIIQAATALPMAPSGAQGAAAEPPLPRVVLPPLADELGTVPHSGRTLIGNDGRLGAWQEAFDEGNRQPALGFGFGTESNVFVDRLVQFHANRPENSYFGLYLELGAVGVALLVGFGVLALIATVRRRAADPAIAGTAGAVAAGFALAFGQSFAYAAGNVAMLSFWVAGFLTLGLARPQRVLGIGRSLAVAAVVAIAAIPVGRWQQSRAIAHQRAGIERVWQAVGARLDAPSLDGFRRSPPVDCLLYRAPAYELCFDDGRLVEAYDRRKGFHGWTLEQYRYAHAPVTVDATLVQNALRALGAFGPKIGDGPAYLARHSR